MYEYSRWVKQYPFDSCNSNRKIIAEKLKELVPLTEKGIIDIIGNKSWTENSCNECGKDSETTIWIGGYKELSVSIKICPVCLNKIYNHLTINCL